MSPAEFQLKLTLSSLSTPVSADFGAGMDDADYSQEATINKAHQLIDLYKEQGVDKERVLIKVSLLKLNFN